MYNTPPPIFRRSIIILYTIHRNHAEEPTRPSRRCIFVVVVAVGSLLPFLAEQPDTRQQRWHRLVVQQQQQIGIRVEQSRRTEHVARAAFPQESRRRHRHSREGGDQTHRHGPRDRSGHGKHDRAAPAAIETRDSHRIRQSDDTGGAEARRGYIGRTEAQGGAGRCDKNSFPILRRVRRERPLSDLVRTRVQAIESPSDVPMRGDDVPGGVRAASHGEAGGGAVLPVEREHTTAREGRSAHEGGEE